MPLAVHLFCRSLGRQDSLGHQDSLGFLDFLGHQDSQDTLVMRLSARVGDKTLKIFW